MHITTKEKNKKEEVVMTHGGETKVPPPDMHGILPFMLLLLLFDIEIPLLPASFSR
jgi:hypothetical protein